MLNEYEIGRLAELVRQYGVGDVIEGLASVAYQRFDDENDGRAALRWRRRGDKLMELAAKHFPPVEG